MKMWDFTDFNFVVLFSVSILCALIVVIAITSFIMINNRSKKYEKLIFDEKKTMRIYILDLKNNVVTFINRNNIRSIRIQDLASFYSRFHKNDVEKIKNWIFSMTVEGMEVSPFITADMVLYSRKTSYFTLLKLRKYSKESNCLYLESYIFKDIIPNSDKKLTNSKHNSYGYMSKNNASRVFNNHKSLNGFTFSIRLFFKNQKTAFEQSFDQLIVNALKNEIFPLVKSNKSRLLCENGTKEMVLTDFSITKKEDAVVFASSLITKLKSICEITGFYSEVDISIGVIENREHFQDYISLLDRASRTSLQASIDKVPFLFYQHNAYFSNLEVSKLSGQVDSIINDNKINYLFRPIIDASKGKSIGYLSNLKLEESSFSSVFEANKYATQINKGKEFLSLICKSVLTKFVNENIDSGSKLFLPISLNNLVYIKEVLSSIPQYKKSKLVLILDEQEIFEVLKRQDTMKDLFSLLNDNDYHRAILIKDRNLSLNQALYSCFNYFIVDASISKEIRRSNRARLSIHILIENLLRFKKPIISIDLDGWISIELMVESGINLISSETISPSSNMILPIERKKLEKVIAIGEKYN